MDASDRGWGPGWPNCAETKTAVTTVAGIKWRLRRETIPLFTHLIEQWHKRVERLTPGHCWSYACRAVRGSDPPRPSNHCLGADTLVTTPDGPQRIGDLAGTVARLLTRQPMSDGKTRGRWVDAPIRSFGKEPVAQVRMSRGGETRTITASLTHRWFVTLPSKTGDHEVVERRTSELQAGDHLATCHAPAPPRITPSVFGIMHGIVFGDGTTQPGCGTKVTLWGAKRDLLRYFPPGSPMSPRSRDTGIEGIEIRGLPDDWKFIQRRDVSATHRAGFLAGLIATDGHVRTGEVRLSSRSRETLFHVGLLAQSLGIETRAPRVEKMSGGYAPGDQWSLAFIAATVPEWLLIRDDQREAFDFTRRVRRPQEWRVVEIVDEGAVEEVFCATVESTGAFTLDGQLLTGNSWGLAVDFNAPAHPLGARGTYSPAQVREINKLLAEPWARNFTWGGNYTRRADEMHIEYVGTPTECAAETRLIPKPTPEPTPEPAIEGDDMAYIKAKGSPEVWITNGITRRHVADQTELSDLKKALPGTVVEVSATTLNRIKVQP